MPIRNKPTPKVLEGLVKPAKKDVHARFAEHSQLLRWFHERSFKELKALRQAFETAQGIKPQTKIKKDERYD
jgi:hypothetical protein